MQRWCTKLRSLSLSSSSSFRPSNSLQWQTQLLHSSPSPLSRSLFHFSSALPQTFKPLGNTFASSLSWLPGHFSITSRFPTSVAVQVRNFSAKSKEKKWKKLTPIVSKVKKTKMKTYSSYKRRFRLQKDGTIRRWREGKRHNAHLKSKSAKRRLRKPSTVPVAYAKVMKKLNFCSA